MAMTRLSPGGRVHVLVKPSDVPREVHDQAEFMLLAAISEAGFPVSSTWDATAGCYSLDQDRDELPDAVVHRARMLVCDRLGIPYEIVED